MILNSDKVKEVISTEKITRKYVALYDPFLVNAKDVMNMAGMPRVGDKLGPYVCVKRMSEESKDHTHYIVYCYYEFKGG